MLISTEPKAQEDVEQVLLEGKVETISSFVYLHKSACIRTCHGTSYPLWHGKIVSMMSTRKENHTTAAQILLMNCVVPLHYTGIFAVSESHVLGNAYFVSTAYFTWRNCIFILCLHIPEC